MRTRKKDRHLPACVYKKHGAYWYVKKGKWTRIGKTLPEAMTTYAHLISDPSATMNALITTAHPYIIDGKADSTIKQYSSASEKLKTMLDEYQPSQVKPRDIAGIKNHYAKRPNMGNRIISYLRMVFNYAVEHQIVESNPCIGIKPHKEKKGDRYITDAEFDAVRAVSGDNLKAIIDIAYLTGQRIGDLLSIELTDITETGPMNKRGIYFRQEKGDVRLLVQMTPELQSAIDAAKQLKRSKRGTTLFCTMRGGRPYKYATVKDMWNRAVIKSGIEHATFHNIRAKSLTDAKNQGKDATKLAGHSDARTTEIYIRQHDTIVAEPPTFKR